jgi:hypothetical protein
MAVVPAAASDKPQGSISRTERVKIVEKKQAGSRRDIRAITGE